MKRLAIVCCQHGDERFGLDVYGFFQERLADFPGLGLFIANPPAVEANVRKHEKDMNTCWPGSSDGKKLEERLAASLFQEIKDYEYVLDIHTTTSEMSLAAIIGEPTEGVRRLLACAPAEQAVRMPPHIAKGSLIDVVPACVALEYGDSYAESNKESLLEELERTVRLLFAGKPRRKELAVFDSVLRVGIEYELPSNVRNLEYCVQLKGYPFLAKERSNADYQMHGYRARRKATLKLA